MSLSRFERKPGLGQITVQTARPIRSESPAPVVSIETPRSRNDLSKAATAGLLRSASSMESWRRTRPMRAYLATSASALR